MQENWFNYLFDYNWKCNISFTWIGSIFEITLITFGRIKIIIVTFIAHTSFLRDAYCIYLHISRKKDLTYFLFIYVFLKYRIMAYMRSDFKRKDLMHRDF